MPDPHNNFAYSTVATAPSPASSGTSLVVQAADGAKFPSSAAFNATVWPASTQPTTANAEIVRVTAISTDTFTITRTQEGTSARTIVIGDQIAATITAKTLTDVELDQYPNVFLTAKDETVAANTQVIYDDYLELAASFVYELASGAQLVIGDFAAPTIQPGYRIGYDQITANVTVASTTEATGTPVINGSPYIFDGGLVRCEFFSPLVRTGTTLASQVIVCLFEGTTQLTRLSLVQTPAAALAGCPVLATYYFTPTAGLHAYQATVFSTNITGTPIVAAGAGGTAANNPAYLAFFKA